MTEPTSDQWPDFDEATLFPAHYAWEQEWDRDAALQGAMRRGRLADRVIAAMWVHSRSLERESQRFARLKTDYERLLAKKIIAIRVGVNGQPGEKSGEIAKMMAHDDDEVYLMQVRFRAAEGMRTADREALRILQARLDDLRTQAADARAGNRYHAEEGGTP